MNMDFMVESLILSVLDFSEFNRRMGAKKTLFLGGRIMMSATYSQIVQQEKHV